MCSLELTIHSSTMVKVEEVQKAAIDLGFHLIPQKPFLSCSDPDRMATIMAILVVAVVVTIFYLRQIH